MQRAFELRYQVYCEECRFLPASDYPQRRESDEHDARSAHFCAFNLRDELVGYVRLVRPDDHGSFPFQQHSRAVLEGMALAPAQESAEISRLMLRQDYRRRSTDLLSGPVPEEESDAEQRKRRDHSPQILLSLYRSMYAFSVEHHIRYWYAAMERSLARILTRMSFPFRQLGPQTDYYGPVAAYLMDLRELEASLGQNHASLMAWLHRSEADNRSGPTPASGA
jgi:N-acyl amino acid synthase of PEP-CTERM/exosortase system